MGRSIAPEHHHPLGGGGVGNGTLAPHGDIGQRKAQPNFSHGSLSKVYLRQKKKNLKAQYTFSERETRLKKENGTETYLDGLTATHFSHKRKIHRKARTGDPQ